MRAYVLLAYCALTVTVVAQSPAKGKAVIWQDPGDIHARDLRFGPGGERDSPKGNFTFVKEDTKQNSAKFDVKDDQGRKWKAKLGVEARSETAATHLLSAIGFQTDEDYFLPDIEVAGLPKLHRGAEFQKGEHVRNVRLELKDKGEKKDEKWHWRKNPFTDTREFNGLRTMMCVLDNWDLKDENNTVYRDKDSGEERYVVSDLGATLGRAGRSWTSDMSKDNPDAYAHAKFVNKKNDKYVDFNISQHLPWIYVFNIVKPLRYWEFKRYQWVGHKIPREDAKWVGGLLAQLSDEQLRSAFVSAGYNENEQELLIGTLKKRIRELQEL